MWGNPTSSPTGGLGDDAVQLGFGALAGSRVLNPTFSAGLWKAHSGYFELKGMAAREIHGPGLLGRVGWLVPLQASDPAGLGNAACEFEGTRGL